MTPEAPQQATAAGADAAVTLSALRRFMRRPEVRERCELCSAEVQSHPRHEHLLEQHTGQVTCSCSACAMIFPVNAGKRYLRIPRVPYRLDGFVMSEDQWDSLAIPVRMAYVQLHPETRAPRAFYPSPAGPTESLLSLDGWAELVRDNASLSRLQPGVEALLINRIGEVRDHYIAPIDRCFELVGLIRLNWRGLSGGQEVWQRVAEFFTALQRQAQPVEASVRV